MTDPKHQLNSLNLQSICTQVLVEEDLAGNAEKMGKRLREGIAGFNSPLVTEIRGRGLLNAIVIDESMGKNASSDGFAWDICVDMAEMGEPLLRPLEHSHFPRYTCISHFLLLPPRSPCQTNTWQHHPIRASVVYQRL